MGVAGGAAAGAGAGAAAGSFLPGIGTGIGAALGAGIGGLTNYFGGKAKAEEEKKEAMRELYNRYLNHGNMLQIGKAPAQGPSMEESFGMPILNAGISTLAAGKPKEGEDWYERAAKGYLGAVR